VTDAFELIFDTLSSSRKIANLRRQPRIAFVIGGYATGDQATVQYEGVADEPWGTELARCKAAYLAAWPDGREREHLPDIVYVRVRPTWIRYSDYSQEPAQIEEFDRERLAPQ
jgi:general stress protein 26